MSDQSDVIIIGGGPAGLTAGWTTVTRPNVTLFGGSRDVVEIVVRKLRTNVGRRRGNIFSVRVNKSRDNV